MCRPGWCVYLLPWTKCSDRLLVWWLILLKGMISSWFSFAQYQFFAKSVIPIYFRAGRDRWTTLSTGHTRSGVLVFPNFWMHSASTRCICLGALRWLVSCMWVDCVLLVAEWDVNRLHAACRWVRWISFRLSLSAMWVDCMLRVGEWDCWYLYTFREI